MDSRLARRLLLARDRKLDFEVKATDLAGRICLLHTRHGVIETPALLPVVHPTKQKISPREIRRIGFEAVMTNAYLALKHAKAEAEEKGIHGLIGFDGVVMTDSGGYQVLEYGDVEVTPKEIVSFEEAIGPDIATILDRPTGFDVSREFAEKTVEETVRSSKLSLKSRHRDDVYWMGPIQGGKYLDLLKASTRKMKQLEFDVYALGSPTEVMENYEFTLLAQMIQAVKSELPVGRPLHLFGAGHPLTIPLAVALGCDTFDSASYALYAKEGRYMTDHGTLRLEDLSYLPCVCPVCSAGTVREVKQADELLALHNLYVLHREVLAVKQAIREGRLWEYLFIKARCHPKLHEAVQAVAQFSGLLEDGTPSLKGKALFLFAPADFHRPEMAAARKRIANNLSRGGRRVFLIVPEQAEKPFYKTPIYHEIEKKLQRYSNPVQVYFLVQGLGLVPVEISDTYPLSQYLSSQVFSGDKEVEKLTLIQCVKMVERLKPKSILLFDGIPSSTPLMKKLAKKLRNSCYLSADPSSSNEEAVELIDSEMRRLLKTSKG